MFTINLCWRWPKLVITPSWVSYTYVMYPCFINQQNIAPCFNRMFEIMLLMNEPMAKQCRETKTEQGNIGEVGSNQLKIHHFINKDLDWEWTGLMKVNAERDTVLKMQGGRVCKSNSRTKCCSQDFWGWQNRGQLSLQDKRAVFGGEWDNSCVFELMRETWQQ